MSEQFLDAAEVGPVVEHVSGETVPQGMGADGRVQSGFA